MLYCDAIDALLRLYAGTCPWHIPQAASTASAFSYSFVACNSGLRQYLCCCTSSCVSICTFVLANLVKVDLIFRHLAIGPVPYHSLVC
jgi:hypothetical protein